MFEEQATKVKITSVVILVGMSAMLAAVATDHWAVLSPRVEKLNATCEAAHFGLWRLCKKSIFIVEEDPQGKGCGPISLPGGTVASASYSFFVFLFSSHMCLVERSFLVSLTGRQKNKLELFGHAEIACRWGGEKKSDLKDGVWRFCRPVENTAVHPCSPSVCLFMLLTHTGISTYVSTCTQFESTYGRLCSQLLAEMSLSPAEKVSFSQTAKVNGVNDVHGCYT